MSRIDKEMGLRELLGRKSMTEKQEDDLEAVSLSFTKGAGMQRKGHIYCGSNVKSPIGCNKGPNLEIWIRENKKIGPDIQKTTWPGSVWLVKNSFGPILGSTLNNLSQPSTKAPLAPGFTQNSSPAVSTPGISIQLSEVSSMDSPQVSLMVLPVFSSRRHYLG